MQMHPDKFLSVKTNRHTSAQQILRFLNSKAKWIEKNIVKFKILHEQFKIPTFTTGAHFPFLGELKYLQFEKTSLRRTFFKFEDGFLVCYRPENPGLREIDIDDLSEKLKKYYKSEAEAYLKKRMYYWSEVIGLIPNKLVFRSNQTRWGSCSSRQHISLNWKLICQSQTLIDYVIVHELCHLQHLNHSVDFWNLVERHFPSYESVEKVLNQQERLGRFLD